MLPAAGLVLRPWREDDLDAVWAALQDPELRRWNDAGSGSRDDARALLARRRDWSTGDHCSWAIVDPADQLLGSLSLHAIDRAQADAEVGYWTVPAARGRRVAVRAVDAACRWGFATLELDRVELFHAVENEASGRVAARAGFTCEGRLRRSFRYGDGVKHDELLWSRLSDDPPPALH
ncbi:MULTISPECIES: GNAT family N-acetyltransferase [unclassified Modestobacter]|uniref:GNAT family N-acetyltransferase n=1 Tax=unclassified Modestobacter TaxID=2643866 RepID=UPI0022AA5D19|nr:MULTISPECIES: GNAT family N-acetyltransferase [unclassified Modestobacter]MCZ2822893.1 GNAT family N-acetyltransferase [Modestobacter sp. VKM Ac-2981]MCZ2851139.1 GNAT family N-acetyltransferase [Modestobacter sp. VKM Ac-2982]